MLFETNSAGTSIKYPRPNILLIDLDAATKTSLQAEGYNVSSGSFGVPYKVPKSDKLIPVIANGDLTKSTVSEQDIVIVDLVPGEALDEIEGEKHTSQGEDDWWASCSRGVVDPRPRLMAYLQQDFNRIVEHGGMFVVFADCRREQDLFWGHYESGYGFVNNLKLTFDNWSFLESLSTYYLNVNHDQGKNISVVEADSSLRTVLSKYARKTQFLCTLQGTIKEQWYSIAENKYGASIAGVLVPANSKGLVLILPQFQDKPSFLSALLREALPEIIPDLFPYVEGARWVQRPEYELPKILELKHQIEEVETDAKKRVTELEQNIETERNEASYQHALISATGRPLVLAVKKTLETLGFESVVDVDEETEESNDSGFLNEDLHIHDGSPLLLIEVKGIANLPKDEDALAVSKYEATRMREWDRTDVKGLSIINHQRHVPALERENEATFRNVVLQSAQRQKIGLLTTWDLHRLLRSYLKNSWSHEQVRPLFYQNGRVHPVPEHYKLIGVVERFIEQLGVVGVKLTEGKIRQGDRIAFELPVEFLEQNAESLGVEGEKVGEASRESLVGIKTELTKGQAKQGTRVYRVT